MRSGYVNISYGRLWYAGIGGYDWPRAAAVYTNGTTATAYNLLFYAANVDPSNNYNRWAGFSLRCLAD